MVLFPSPKIGQNEYFSALIDGQTDPKQLNLNLFFFFFKPMQTLHQIHIDSSSCTHTTPGSAKKQTQGPTEKQTKKQARVYTKQEKYFTDVSSRYLGQQTCRPGEHLCWCNAVLKTYAGRTVLSTSLGGPGRSQNMALHINVPTC